MKYFDQIAHPGVRVGLANGPGVADFVSRNPDAIDYVEIAFEQLRNMPAAGHIQEIVPAILHCASMSVAGFVPPGSATLEAISAEAERMKTPWIGEHLTFITADPVEGAEPLDAATPFDAAVPTNLTYTVSPQFSAEVLEQVEENLERLRGFFDRPLILENPPQYFAMPGSTMSFIDFVEDVYDRCDVGMLLDLTHFVISARNGGFDAFAEIDRLPLERVVEIHISGISVQAGVAWDDHSRSAPAEVFDLLERALSRARPRAITFEYNWTRRFSDEMLLGQIARVRDMAMAPA